MSAEVTPESLRATAKWLRDRGAIHAVDTILCNWAGVLEREPRPLPTVPGWYAGIVVERGGESCTGALRSDDVFWYTARAVGGRRCHLSCDETVTIRWAEQEGKTPGQTLWEADRSHCATWRTAEPEWRVCSERIDAAVLAAHGTPTLTPVGEHPKLGTRGLLPVVLESGSWHTIYGAFLCHVDSAIGSIILADPRPDGAQ